MIKKNILICIDRDGTIIYDDKYHLGSQKDWKNKICFLNGVIPGMMLLNKKLPKAAIYMMTNQTGVARKDKPLLTQKRAEVVCKEIISRIRKDGVKIKKCIVCSHASPEYVRKKEKKGVKFYKNLVCNCSCIKPNPGMIKQALKKQKWTQKNTEIYVIGDRFIDVKTAINAKSFGILVPFKKEPGQINKIKKMKNQKNIYIAKNFLGAIKYIIKRENK